MSTVPAGTRTRVVNRILRSQGIDTPAYSLPAGTLITVSRSDEPRALAALRAFGFQPSIREQDGAVPRAVCVPADQFIA